jgi:serine-type D-Ala-D-Ala endopeptidase (penicillin-binding protein 7)
MYKKRSLLAMMFSSLLVLALNQTGYAKNISSDSGSSSGESYVVYDLTAQSIIGSHAPDKIRPIASLTKLMTANIFTAWQPDLMCQAQLEEVDVDYLKHTHSRLPKNQPISCKKLFMSMLISSDNMAAMALSRSINNVSREEFVAMMNEQAKKWGMTNTHFVDPTGLSPANTSNAHDLVILMQHSLANSLITDVVHQGEGVVVSESGQIIAFKNTNKLIREYNYQADLSKTGYIKESGYNLIYVPKDTCQNHKVGFVILGASSSSLRSNQAQTILRQLSCPY